MGPNLFATEDSILTFRIEARDRSSRQPGLARGGIKLCSQPCGFDTDRAQSAEAGFGRGFTFASRMYPPQCAKGSSNRVQQFFQRLMLHLHKLRGFDELKLPTTLYNSVYRTEENWRDRLTVRYLRYPPRRLGRSCCDLRPST
jgi:hypothetical protein